MRKSSIYGLGSAIALMAMGGYARSTEEPSVREQPVKGTKEPLQPTAKKRPRKKLVVRDDSRDHAAHIQRAEAKRLRKAQKLLDRGHL